MAKSLTLKNQNRHNSLFWKSGNPTQHIYKTIFKYVNIIWCAHNAHVQCHIPVYCIYIEYTLIRFDLYDSASLFISNSSCQHSAKVILNITYTLYVHPTDLTYMSNRHLTRCFYDREVCEWYIQIYIYILC